ncbi:MAG: hypothetical protein WBD40_17000 [Tepidisphaeraceae bacterium]
MRLNAEQSLFADRATLGLTILVWVAPLLAAAMLLFRNFVGVGLPLASLNFPGPKAWAIPLITKYGSSQITAVYPICALVLLNGFAIWLLTTPPPGSEKTRGTLPLRRVLRFYLPIGLAICWTISDASVAWVSVSYLSQPLVAHLTVELPCTAMLYLHLSGLAQRIGRGDLAKSLRHIMWAALAVAILSVPNLSGRLPLEQFVPRLVLPMYGVALFILGFRAADLLLELRHEVRLAPIATKSEPA